MLPHTDRAELLEPCYFILIAEMVEGPHQNGRFQPVRFAGLPDLHQDQRRVAAECSFGANGNELDGQSYAVNQSTSNSINQSIHPSINHCEFKRLKKTLIHSFSHSLMHHITSDNINSINQSINHFELKRFKKTLTPNLPIKF